jgi:hypothetical protein
MGLFATICVICPIWAGGTLGLRTYFWHYTLCRIFAILHIICHYGTTVALRATTMLATAIEGETDDK